MPTPDETEGGDGSGAGFLLGHTIGGSCSVKRVPRLGDQDRNRPDEQQCGLAERMRPEFGLSGTDPATALLFHFDKDSDAPITLDSIQHLLRFNRICLSGSCDRRARRIYYRSFPRVCWVSAEAVGKLLGGNRCSKGELPVVGLDTLTPFPPPQHPAFPAIRPLGASGSIVKEGNSKYTTFVWQNDAKESIL
jgi:hypothetical protein